MDQQDNQARTYAALGVAGQMGCFMLILVIAALLIGLGLDRVLHTGRLATLVCVIGSIPITLIITMLITRRLISRVIPPDSLRKPGTATRRDRDMRDSEDQNT